MIVIDAYNCLHAASAMRGPVTGLSLRQLCRFLQDAPEQIVLVMDGVTKPDEPSDNEFPTLTLRYSGRAAKADDVIVRLLAKSTGARNITVVSNDRAVAASARRAGARSIACETFLSRLTPSRTRRITHRREPEEKSRGLTTPGLTDAWLKEFGFKPPASSPPKT